MNHNPRKFVLDETVEEFGGSSAIIADNFSITYREYHTLVCEAANRLHNSWTKRENKLAVISPNCIEYVILLMALLRSGIISVPLSTQLPEKQLVSLLDSIFCQTIIVSPLYAGAVVPVRIEKFFAIVRNISFAYWLL